MSQILLASMAFHRPPSPITLTYVSDGDANGVCYLLGSNFGGAPWSNPDTSGAVVVTRSSSLAGTDADLVDRAINYNTTDNNAGEWVAIDLGAGNTFVVSDYSMQNGSQSPSFDHTPRNWKLQGSNDVSANTVPGIDGATWDDLDTRSNNTDIASSSGAWGHFILGSTPSAYRWLRVLATGINNGGDATVFLQIGEFEFYGDLAF